MKKIILLICFLIYFQTFSQDFLVLVEQGNLHAFTSKNSIKKKEAVLAGKVFRKNTTIFLDTAAYLLLFNPRLGFLEFQGSEVVDLSLVQEKRFPSSFKLDNLDSTIFKELIASSQIDFQFAHRRMVNGTCLPAERCPPPFLVLINGDNCSCSSAGEIPVFDNNLHFHLKVSPYYESSGKQKTIPITIFIKNFVGRNILEPQKTKIEDLREELCVNIDVSKIKKFHKEFFIVDVYPNMHAKNDIRLGFFYFDSTMISKQTTIPKVQDEKDWYGFLRLAYFYEQNKFFNESLRYWEKVLALKNNIEAFKILYQDFRIRNHSFKVFSKSEKCLQCIEINKQNEADFIKDKYKYVNKNMR
ncbi:hypothetical protein [Raineya orbicola]|jgi:hypothetical protein|uniref:Uncharacterized protein n=1 Tax=Raineya orbicola TaxID=2016530 RepID=A0A2N3I899_9BACT|nr:hypothetical protein [Raineya orbicola]PKQ66554.1 hypothetical protein Rain11_2349 [Raineya orbicola]